MSTLDALTPLHYLAHVLMAEQRRKDLGLPENAPVITARWLVTREELRFQGVVEAMRWAMLKFGGIKAAERAVTSMPAFVEWQGEETAQAEARGKVAT
jgi:hypothetical protein